MNERANSNAWIQPHTHDNQWTAWDANLGCKDVAYTLSLVAQEAYAKNGSGGTFERRKYVANEVRKNCLASIVNVPKNKNLPTQSETKFVRSKKPARACNAQKRCSADEEKNEIRNVFGNLRSQVYASVVRGVGSFFPFVELVHDMRAPDIWPNAAVQQKPTQASERALKLTTAMPHGTSIWFVDADASAMSSSFILVMHFRATKILLKRSRHMHVCLFSACCRCLFGGCSPSRCKAVFENWRRENRRSRCWQRLLFQCPGISPSSCPWW